jgi:uncharacterized protein
MLKIGDNLARVVEFLEHHLTQTHPQFFGEEATRPVAALKPDKVIHDPIWGTNKFSWRELVILDSPLIQRLRNIQQTGLAHFVYPAARHSRFEHSLGVTVVASKVFDSLLLAYRPNLEEIAKATDSSVDSSTTFARWRQELRLAALLHDSGHSLYSHTSERVYSRLAVLHSAAEELGDLIGREKGAGEVISFCLAQTPSIHGVLKRAKSKVSSKATDVSWDVDWDNVALLVVGSSRHPYLQFLGDIISSGLDADKLDYLLRDAVSAGLPLKYDIERYLYSVLLERDVMADVKGSLAKLYEQIGTKIQPNPPQAKDSLQIPSYDTYRLRLPKKASNTIEQIVICKIMLYSYIYHHQKVRAAEGLLELLLTYKVEQWRAAKLDDFAILAKFMSLDDTSMSGDEFAKSTDPYAAHTSYRIITRLLPREVYRFTPTVTHAEGALIREFFLFLKDREKRADVIHTLENLIGEDLIVQDNKFGPLPADALRRAGVWVDVPKGPKVEDVDLSEGEDPSISIQQIFPVEKWTEAYQAHRYFVRIFAYSEYVPEVRRAGKVAMARVVGIKSDSFYSAAERKR